MGGSAQASRMQSPEICLWCGSLLSCDVDQCEDEASVYGAVERCPGALMVWSVLAQASRRLQCRTRKILIRVL